MIRNRHRRRLVATVLLPAVFAACTTWKPVELTPQQTSLGDSVEVVRVTTQAHHVTLWYPRVVGDSLHGPRWREGGATESFALQDIAMTERRVSSPGTTIAVVVGVVAVVAAVLAMTKFKEGVGS